MKSRVAPFTPIPVSPNASMTSDGLRLYENGMPLQRVRVSNAADLRQVLPTFQTLVVAAVAELLPGTMDDGREAWSVVNEALFLFCRTGDNRSPLMDVAAQILFVGRLLMHNKPSGDDQKVLAVFVDLYFHIALGETVAMMAEQRAPTLQSVYSDLHSGEPQEVIRKIILPWPGRLGSELEPFDTVISALDSFDSGDLSVVGDSVEIAVGWPVRRMIELRFTERGIASVRELIASARAAASLPAGQNGTLGGTVDGSRDAAVGISRDERYRVNVNSLSDGQAKWVFRRLFQPKATNLNFGFDI
jgi:hypothetical protein